MRWCCGASPIAPAGPPTLTAEQLAKVVFASPDAAAQANGAALPDPMWLAAQLMRVAAGG